MMSAAAKKKRPETPSDLRARARKILERLRKDYPRASTALTHSNPLDLLVATILSAQCTDERVNVVTKDLFKKYRTAKDYANANQSGFEQEIRSTGFFRAKAKSIIQCCKALVQRHRGEVPTTMEELVQLPGVGRKTANVVLGNAFGIAEGIVVDTHVKRLAERVGLSSQSNPDKIELDLMEIFPKKRWIALGNVLIWHGRKICTARKPKCPECSVNDLCPSAELFMKKQ